MQSSPHSDSIVVTKLYVMAGARFSAKAVCSGNYGMVGDLSSTDPEPPAHFSSCSSSSEENQQLKMDKKGSRFRADSEGFVFPETSSNVVSPHLLAQPSSPHTAAASGHRSAAGKKEPGCTILEEEEEEEEEGELSVSMHKLNTELGSRSRSEKKRLREGLDESQGFELEFNSYGYSYAASPSPSPLSEPTFEPYVYCTKTRSETSYSNESQFSSSSGERGEVPVSASAPSSCSAISHRPLSRQSRSVNGTEQLEIVASPSPVPCSPLAGEGVDEVAAADPERVTMLISPNHDSPQQVLCRTRPVPLPPQSDIDLPSSSSDDQQQLPASPLYFPSVHSTNQTPSLPISDSPPTTTTTTTATSGLPPTDSPKTDFLTSQRSRATFLQNKVSQEGSKFAADYLGMKDTDMYIKSINMVAKELAANQRPMEMHVFVTSERVRLAPPNSVTLFRSFSIKDVLLVRKCSKNKRIIGVMVWKQRGGRPTCHILRCQDNLVASALYDCIWQQTQKVDEVELSKEDKTDAAPHPPDRTDVPRPLSTDTISSQSSSGSSMSPTPSFTDVLHRFAAVYVGSTTSVKLLSTDGIIEKVLMDSKPSRAASVIASLSLVAIKYVPEGDGGQGLLLGGDEEEGASLISHNTSRVRSMGAYSEDKRFGGYVIKEEGKPLMGHVVRCNSAALMVNFMSFLRQACQLTSYQRGGAFYEELSTDESGDWGDDTVAENSTPYSSDNSRFGRRLRSFTSSITQITSLSTSPASAPPSLPSPSFRSHMLTGTQQDHTPSPSPLSTSSQQSPGGGGGGGGRSSLRKKDSTSSLTSPLDLGEDDYARFSVTYIGSATRDSPLTLHCIDDALSLFAEKGTAAGQAAVQKNTIQLQITSLGINLTDKSRKLFIHRNYPRKTIAGYCKHPKDGKLFAVVSNRPGFPNIKRVHVFRCGAEPAQQIMDAVEYWLQMKPIQS